MPRYDYKAARAAGLADDDIAKYLADQRNQGVDLYIDEADMAPEPTPPGPSLLDRTAVPLAVGAGGTAVVGGAIAGGRAMARSQRGRAVGAQAAKEIARDRGPIGMAGRMAGAMFGNGSAASAPGPAPPISAPATGPAPLSPETRISEAKAMKMEHDARGAAARADLAERRLAPPPAKPTIRTKAKITPIPKRTTVPAEAGGRLSKVSGGGPVGGGEAAPLKLVKGTAAKASQAAAKAGEAAAAKAAASSAAMAEARAAVLASAHPSSNPALKATAKKAVINAIGQEGWDSVMSATRQAAIGAGQRFPKMLEAKAVAARAAFYTGLKHLGVLERVIGGLEIPFAGELLKPMMQDTQTNFGPRQLRRGQPSTV